jgi:hypothetical protein
VRHCVKGSAWPRKPHARSINVTKSQKFGNCSSVKIKDLRRLFYEGQSRFDPAPHCFIRKTPCLGALPKYLRAVGLRCLRAGH